MNVYDVAMKMELDGKAYYEKLASDHDQPGLQAIFSSLAEDEQKHFEAFKTLKEGGRLPELADGSSLAAVQNVFAGLSGPDGASPKLQGSLDAYRHAMDVEAESKRFYEKAASEESDPRIREVLLKIAAEEERHFEIMENIYQFVNEPNQTLSGAEISNHEE